MNGFRIRLFGFEIWFLPLLALWPWMSYLVSPLFIYKSRIKIFTSSHRKNVTFIMCDFYFFLLGIQEDCISRPCDCIQASQVFGRSEVPCVQACAIKSSVQSSTPLLPVFQPDPKDLVQEFKTSQFIILTTTQLCSMIHMYFIEYNMSSKSCLISHDPKVIFGRCI